MKRLQCEMCGSQDLVKEGGVFVCQACGTKYSVEEAKKMMVEGTVSVEGTVAVEGTVKVDKSEELKNLLVLARRAKEMDNAENASKYYNEILLKEPNNWEANFYLVYYKAASCKKGQVGNEAYNVANCIKSTIKLIIDSLGTGEEATSAIMAIKKDLTAIVGPMIDSAHDVSEYRYIGQILRMQEELGNCLIEYPEYQQLAIDVWKDVIDSYIKYACFGEAKIPDYDIYGYSPQQTIQLIYNIDPTYIDPFNIAEQLRRKEKFITCPKCGAQFRERDKQCPNCGCSKEEMLQLKEAAKAKEAEEKAKAEEAKRAKAIEDAKVRREKRQEWWRKYHKYIYIGLGIVLFCCIIYILIYSITKVNERKEADVKALAELQIGDSLLSLSNYEEAITHYQSAMKYAQSDEVQRTCNLHNDSAQAIISRSISSLVQGCWERNWGHDGFDYAYFYGNQCEFNIPETGEDVHAHYEIKGNTLVALDDQNHTIRQFLVKDSAVYINGDSYNMCKITPNDLLHDFQYFSMHDAAKKLMNVFHIQETKLVLNLKGNIGSATDGVLVFDEATNSGYYVYGLSGVAVKRSLKLESHNGDKLILTAYDKQGKYIGKFDGEYINGIFSGIFTNYKQVSISFKLHN